MKAALPSFAAPDFAKFLGIVLVVFGHVIRGLFNAGVLPRSDFWMRVDAGIYLFHMPLFFFLSGLFFVATFERRGQLDFWKRNSFTLLLPLLVWSYIQFSIQYLAGDAANVRKTLMDVLTAPFPPKEQFWFLWTLFLVSGLSAFLLGAFKKVGIFGILFFASSIFYALSDKLGFADTANGYFFKNCPFFFLGIIFRNWRPRTPPSIGILGAVAVFTVVEVCFLFGPPFSNATTLPFAILCVLSVYFFCIAISTAEFLKHSSARVMLFIGMNSMIIYLAHVIFEAAVRAILLKMKISDIGLHIILGWLAGMVAPLLFGLFMLRFGAKAHPIVGYMFPARGSR